MSAPPVAMPDAVAVVGVRLRARLTARGITAPVGSMVPTPRPPRFVRLERIGGSTHSVVTDRPRLDVHCWGADEADAHDLMQVCRAELGAARGRFGDTTFARPETSGPQWLPDKVSGQARYAFTYDVTLRGEAL
ncbi:hypothetical protein ACFVTT_15620 [Streptomyces niveus]|uniref:hypothetical protein n=1 Tax=Streptomyces niveus TaxID=193462 RepID=UPI00344845D0